MIPFLLSFRNMKEADLQKRQNIPCYYCEFAGDDHSSTVYSQFEVFVPVSWDHTEVLRNIGVALSVQNTGILKAETSSRHLA